MPNLAALTSNLVPQAKRWAFGLAHDFWHDGEKNPFAFIPLHKLPLNKLPLPPALKKTIAAKIAPAAPAKPVAAPPAAAPAAPKAATIKDWHAMPGEISEKMWGEGFVAPGTETLAQALLEPLGLKKDMSLLDLSAGLGGRMHKIAEKYGVHVTGLEPDPEIAARGVAMFGKAGKEKDGAVAAYDPNNFSVERQYDSIIIRETLYRVSDKNKFIASIAKATKDKAQIGFTDYIVDPEHKQQGAILAWQAFEKNAAPMGLVEAAEAWAKAGFNLKVHDDQTAYYKKEVLGGLKKLNDFVRTVNPDAETKKALLRRIETWVHRMAAMEAGMKFYRFHGTKG